MEGPKWCDGVVRLAGDGLTAEEIERTYKEVIDITSCLGLGC